MVSVAKTKSVNRIFLLIIFLFVLAEVRAQQADSLSAEMLAVSDTQQIVIDTSFIVHNDFLSKLRSSFSELPPAQRSDIERLHTSQKATWIFIWILFSLMMFAILRNVFKRELGLLLQSFSNKQVAWQSSRSRTSTVTIFSLFLFLMFVVNLSILTSFAIEYFYPKKSINTTQLLFLLFFLFTFFIITKSVIVRILGFVFDIHDVTEVYADDLSVVAKMIAIATFPQVMMICVAEKNVLPYLILFFIITIAIAVLVLLWRGLSTSIELLYKSAYHFFVYICVVEILVVFLFIKLLTKNAF